MPLCVDVRKFIVTSGVHYISLFQLYTVFMGCFLCGRPTTLMMILPGLSQMFWQCLQLYFPRAVEVVWEVYRSLHHFLNYRKHQTTVHCSVPELASKQVLPYACCAVLPCKIHCNKCNTKDSALLKYTCLYRHCRGYSYIRVAFLSPFE